MSETSATVERGVITKWFPERGFGFVEPDTGGPRVFIHISMLPNGNPATGMRVEFVRTDTPRGPRAVEVRAI